MGLDQHRAQITAEWIDTATGEVSRARVAPADRAGVRRSACALARRSWRWRWRPRRAGGSRSRSSRRPARGFIWPSRPRPRRGAGPRSGPRPIAPDARHLRELLMVGRLPESWIPPEHLLDLRARVRLGAPWSISAASGSGASRPCSTTTASGRAAGWSAPSRASGLPVSRCSRRAREEITIALALTDGLHAQPAALDRELRAFARRQAGCGALMRHDGIGPLTSVTNVAELGDARRFSSSREAVRYAGLDITVHQSDARRAPGHLSRQGPAALGWALFEAAQCARRPASPDHDYTETAARLGGNRACLAVARKLLKRSFDTLRTRRGGRGARMTV